MKAHQYFTPELFDFLTDLKRTNTKEWFLANKEHYRSVVQEPLLRFISDSADRGGRAEILNIDTPYENSDFLLRSPS